MTSKNNIITQTLHLSSMTDTLEEHIYETLTELLLNSEGYQELQGLRGPGVSDISIVPLGLGGIISDFKSLLPDLTVTKSMELTVEILESGRVCLGCNITTNEDNTFSISIVTPEPVTVLVEYCFNLSKNQQL